MRKFSILSLVFLSMLITGAAHGKVCFLGDPECQGVLAEKKTLEFAVVKCKKEYPDSINGKDKCIAKDYRAVCKDSTGDYYEEIGCKNGYVDIRENGYVCKDLQCDHCCREEDIGCPEGYVDMDGTTETGRDYSYYYVCTDTHLKFGRCCREGYVKCREEYDVCTPPSENSKYPPELCYETDGSGRYIEKSMVCNCDEDVYKYDYDNCSKHNQLKLDGEPCTTRDGLYITSQKYPKCVCADGYELYTHREFLRDGPDECKCGYKPYDKSNGALLPEVVDGQDAYCAPKIECLACCDTDKYKYTREECEISGMILGSDQCTEDHITHIKRYATSCVCDTSKGQYDTYAACKASKAHSTCRQNGNCYEVSGCETGYELNNNKCEFINYTCEDVGYHSSSIKDKSCAVVEITLPNGYMEQCYECTGGGNTGGGNTGGGSGSGNCLHECSGAYDECLKLNVSASTCSADYADCYSRCSN